MYVAYIYIFLEINAIYTVSVVLLFLFWNLEKMGNSNATLPHDEKSSECLYHLICYQCPRNCVLLSQMFSDLKASQWTQNEVFALISEVETKKDEFDNPTIKKVKFGIELQMSWILKDFTNLQPYARKSGTIWKIGIFNCLMLS